jgi:N-acetylmuramic acid 6-phosphate etherase
MAAHDDDLDPSHAFFGRLLADQKRAIDAVSSAAASIERAAETIAERLSGGGRLIYIGAGSSALIGLQDGAELHGTFGLELSRIVFVIAGGLGEVARIDSAAEDDMAAARRDIAAAAPSGKDIAVAVSASGSTPYTLAAAEFARESGARLVAVANRAASPLLHIGDHPILLDTGPEALHGSTRMAAGTAQKAALGLLSTLANARLGHVYRGHMVNVRPENEKLRRRAVHIVASCAEVGEEKAAACLALAKGDVKRAILLASGAATPEIARDLLTRSRGVVGDALARLRADAK